MKKPLIFLIVFILAISLVEGTSQSFEFKENMPFGIQPINIEDSARFAFKYVFKDMDADGDLDLFLFGMDEADTVSTNSQLQNIRYFIETQENIGDKWNPEFKAREKKFENFNFAGGNSFFLPTIDDLNGDGMHDFVISAYADIDFIQNLRFDIQTSPYNFETHLGSDYDLTPFSPGSIFIPELIDLDMDGDLDLLLSGGFSPMNEEDETIYTYLYAKNIGSSINPNFLGWFPNPYGLESENVPAFICGADLDLDGDMDLLGVAQYDTLQVLNYYQNNPTADGKPLFSEAISAPFGLPTTKSSEEAFYFPSLVDIDGDGDTDLLLPRMWIDTTFGINNTFTLDTVFRLDYFENTLCAGSFESLNETICEGDTIIIDSKKYFEAGNWVIETTDQNGCTKVVQLNLEVIPVNVTIINETLCYGDIYFLGDDPYTESGTYELSLMSISGCDSIILANLDFVEINTNIEVNGSVLQANYNDNYIYQWIDCSNNENIIGATDNVFEPIYSGDFAVVITDESGCIDTSECNYVISSDTKSVFNENDINILPNPSTGYVSIKNNSNKQIIAIDLYSVSGKFIKTYNSKQTKNLNISQFKKGVYLFKIRTQDKSELVKQILLID